MSAWLTCPHCGKECTQNYDVRGCERCCYLVPCRADDPNRLRWWASIAVNIDDIENSVALSSPETEE